VINTEVRDEETVLLSTEGEDENGTQRSRAMMKKVGAEWKLSGYAP